MQRIDYKKVLAHLYGAYARLSQATADGPLPRRLQELIRIRASQINGCAYCLDMHSRDASLSEKTSAGLPS
jgi:AhpD family alkylhydroperoxidase